VDNSKAEYIMGHSFQVVSLLVTAATGQVFAVPLVARICEGLLWGRSANRKTLLDKLVDIFLEVAGVAAGSALLVADAYYASRKVIEPLLAKDSAETQGEEERTPEEVWSQDTTAPALQSLADLH
jgi:hypothetical protein